MSTEQRKGMSPLVKVMIGVSALGVMGIIGFHHHGHHCSRQVCQTALDPAESNKVAQSVARIKQLPPEFQRVLAMDMDAVGMTYVAYADGPDHLTIILMKLKDKTYKKLTPEDLVHTYSRKGSAKSGLPSVPDSFGQKTINGPMHVISAGHKVVGGEQMPYTLGETFANGVHRNSDGGLHLARQYAHARVGPGTECARRCLQYGSHRQVSQLDFWILTITACGCAAM